MQENMKSNQNGILKFTAVTKENLILSYNSLGVNDWFLLTLIPANFLSSGAERYILQSFVIIGLTILLFSLFLFSVYRFYHIHRKQLERLAFVSQQCGISTEIHGTGQNYGSRYVFHPAGKCQWL